MVLYERSYARITPALDIVRRLTHGPLRGYHELQVIKHQIDLFDTIGIEESQRMEIRCNRPGVPVDDTNLCWKAVDLIRRECVIDARARIDLEKAIPAGGGLAGGSSNAATVLRLCNRLWDLNLGADRLVQLGRQLGMDVPYYFTGGTAFDTEVIGVPREISTGLRFGFVLVVPQFGVSTAAAYACLDYETTGGRGDMTRAMEEAFLAGNAGGVIGAVHNDFEASVFAKNPVLVAIRNRLIAAGCLTAFMTGSGSTVVGMARDLEHAGEIAGRIPEYQVITASTLHQPSGSDDERSRYGA